MDEVFTAEGLCAYQHTSLLLCHQSHHGYCKDFWKYPTEHLSMSQTKVCHLPLCHPAQLCASHSACEGFSELLLCALAIALHHQVYVSLSV